MTRVKSLLLRPCAKINLTMEVFEKRQDGYHEVRTVLQSISLRDQLFLTPRKEKGAVLICNIPQLLGEDNLIMRAYDLLAEYFDLGGVEFRLDKHIPWQSGLGGGSADCAATLRGLCQLFQLELSLEELLELGIRLGADVPACLLGVPVLAEGIGEQLTPIHTGPSLELVVLMPPAAFDTPQMYQRLDARQVCLQPISLDDILQGLCKGDTVQVARGLYNHFEEVVPQAEMIAGAKACLREMGALGASMTGAGAAVFGIFSDCEAADYAARQLMGGEYRVFRCHTLADAWAEEETK